MKRQKDISQREYEEQESWLRSFATEQRDRRKLRELVKKYPSEAHKALASQ